MFRSIGGVYCRFRDPDPAAMKLPRWTVYPALATLATLAVTAVPQRGSLPHHEGAANRAREMATERAVPSSEEARLEAELEGRVEERFTEKASE